MYRLAIERFATWGEVAAMTIDEIDLHNIALDAIAAARRDADKGS